MLFLFLICLISVCMCLKYRNYQQSHSFFWSFLLVSRDSHQVCQPLKEHRACRRKARDAGRSKWMSKRDVKDKSDVIARHRHIFMHERQQAEVITGDWKLRDGRSALSSAPKTMSCTSMSHLPIWLWMVTNLTDPKQAVILCVASVFCLSMSDTPCPTGAAERYLLFSMMRGWKGSDLKMEWTWAPECRMKVYGIFFYCRWEETYQFSGLMVECLTWDWGVLGSIYSWVIPKTIKTAPTASHSASRVGFRGLDH